MVNPNADPVAGSGRIATRRRWSPVQRNLTHLSWDALASATLAGFVATSAMTLVLLAAYALAVYLGTADPGSSVVSQWIWALSHNSLTERAQDALPLAVSAHFLSGLVWALVYAGVEPRLKGPGWRRGAMFSLIPWAFSVLVFLPLAGGGLLGFGYGAGPLPVAGNLLVHLVYGLVLGQVYSPWGRRLLTAQTEGEDADEESRLVPHEELIIAVGLVAGLVAGACLTGLASAFGIIDYPITNAALAGACAGSLIGVWLASYACFSEREL